MAGDAAALGSALLWALSNILMGSQSGRMPTVVLSAVRSVFGALFLGGVAVVLVVAGRAGYPTLPRALALAGSGALGLGLGDTLYIGSLRRIGVSRAFPISMAVYPLLTFALAVALLGERLIVPVVLGTAMIMGGVYLIVAARQAPVEGEAARSACDVRAGLALVLASAALWALASVWLRSASDGVQPVLAQAIRMPIAAVVTVIVARGAGHGLSISRYGRRSLAALLLTGVLGTGIGSLLFLIAVQQSGAAKTAVLSSTAPLFALPMAALLLGERVTGRVALGTALSIAGIWLVV